MIYFLFCLLLGCRALKEVGNLERAGKYHRIDQGPQAQAIVSTKPD